MTGNCYNVVTTRAGFRIVWLNLTRSFCELIAVYPLQSQAEVTAQLANQKLLRY